MRWTTETKQRRQQKYSKQNIYNFKKISKDSFCVLKNT